MRASELIAQLRGYIEIFGDKEVRFQDVERNPDSCPIGGVWLADHNQTFLIDSFGAEENQEDDEALEAK